MTENVPTSQGIGRAFGFRFSMRWAFLLAAYLVLLAGTGYVAFFHQEFNPALMIDDHLAVMIENETTRQLTLESLKAEGSAFAARRELAVQSFNIVLGAALGFLSATAAQSRMNNE